MNSTKLAADILALAVAFYRTPLRYPQLLQGQGKLPEGMTLLLRVAGGEIQASGQDEHLAEASAEEIHKAAVFFVEQVCLVPNASYYWMLGLDTGADEQRIKEHHRLLMRLFHPDRRQNRDDWMDAYAGRINQAYNVLRRPALRKAYDVSLSRRVPITPSPPRGSPAYRLAKPALGFTPVFRLPRALLRRLPQLVLVGVSAVAVLLVLGIYLLQGQTVTPVSVSTPVSSPLKQTDELPLAGLNKLMERFTGAYERGNLGDLMALFGDEARTNEGDGKAAIRSHYQQQFDATRSRRIVLTDLRWRLESGYIRGDGSFLVKVQRHDTQRFRNYLEWIRLEIGERNGDLYIRGVYHAKD